MRTGEEEAEFTSSLPQQVLPSVMKICYVAPAYRPDMGGVVTHVAEIASRIAACGHEVEVLAQTFDPGAPASEMVANVLVHRFASLIPNRSYGFAPSLWSYLRRSAHTYDLVHAHSYHALPALGAALTSPNRLIFTPHYHGTGHSGLRVQLHRPYRPLGQLIFRRAACIICVSRVEEEMVRAHFPEAGGRTAVIPNGVDTAAIDGASAFNLDCPVILAGGRLETYKGVDRVVDAMVHLGVRARLCIFGEGPAMPALVRQIDACRLSDRVTMLGQLPDSDLMRWFKTASVFVTMSNHEAFGITILQAAVAGCVVIATDIPAHRETAALATPARVELIDPASTGSSLAHALERTELRRAPSRQLVNVPSWHHVANSVLHLYRTGMPLIGTS